MAPNPEQKKKIALGVVGLVLLVAVYLIYQGMTYVTTDNAMIQGHSSMVSSKVGGVVLEVLANENQKVKAGQVLVRLDRREFENAVKTAESDLGSLQARMNDAQTNYRRITELFKERAVSRQQFDSAEATYKDVAKRYTAVQAQLDTARLNYDYSEIKAPADGMIARRAVEAGMVIPPGQALFGFVADHERWVIANFKETELSDVKPGSKAWIEVDALSGEFHGEVESISPSTGATFTLLPPDNATGNFTKVVQRVPVRIKLTDLTPEQIDLLRVGLSVEVKVRTR